MLFGPLLEKGIERVSWLNLVRNVVAIFLSRVGPSGAPATSLVLHFAPVTHSRFPLLPPRPAILLPPLLPVSLARLRAPLPAPGSTLLHAAESPWRRAPRGQPSRRHDVTPAPPPSGWGAGPQGGLAGRGRGRGPAPRLRGHRFLRGPFYSPAPRPPGPSGAGWRPQPHPEGHRGFRGWVSSAAQCQAPRQLCEFEAAAVALGGGGSGPRPLMVPPRHHRGAGRPGRQAGEGPEIPRSPNRDTVPTNGPTPSCWGR